MGSQKVGHDWATFIFTSLFLTEKWHNHIYNLYIISPDAGKWMNLNESREDSYVATATIRWPKTQNLSVNSPEKTNVCSISTELQLEFCSHGKLYANPCKAKDGNSSIKKGEGNWEGYHKQSWWLFIDWVVARKEIDFLPSFECCHHHRTWELPLWYLNSI